jgi:aspartate aminotransferase-like enzyme
MNKTLLLTPGPTDVPPQVLAAMAKPVLHHRTKEFQAIFASVVEDLKYVYQTQYDVLIFASSGTGAMVSAVSNLLSAGDKAICVRGGKFGERWAEICEAFGVETVNIDVDYGKAPKVPQIQKAVEKNPDAKAVYVTYSETSTGVKTDIEDLGTWMKDRDQVLVVDAITGLGALPLHPEEWGLDVVCGGSQKALMLPPGLGCISISPKAWKLSESSKSPEYYFNWAEEKKNHDKNTTHFTTPVSLIQGLRASLDIIKEQGIENIWKETHALAEATRAAVQALGMKLFAEVPVDSVTAVLPQDGVDPEAIRSRLRDDYGIGVAGGQASMKGKIFRVSHMGFVTPGDTLQFLAALEMILRDMGQDVTPGTAVAAAEAVFQKA